MILARTVRDGVELTVKLRYGHGFCWLNSFRGGVWLNAQSSMRWKDGEWLLRERWTRDEEVIVQEKTVTPFDVMAKVLGTFEVMDDFSLFDAAELERLLSPDSMRELSLTVEVMES